jgi:cation transporter-like permease
MQRSGSPRRLQLTRELGQSLILLALTGSFTGGVLGMLAIATRALGR